MKYIIAFSYLFLISCTNAHTKMETKNSIKAPHSHKAFGKSKGYFQINIKGSENSDGDYTLVANIHPRKEMKQVQIQWKLPKHIDVVSGDKEFTLDFDSGKQKQVTLTIKKDDLKEKDQIFLFAYKTMRGEKHGASHSFVYSSESDVKSSELNQKSKKQPKYFE